MQDENLSYNQNSSYQLKVESLQKNWTTYEFAKTINKGIQSGARASPY